MSVFSHPDFDQHENVHFCFDPETGLKAIIAIHNTNLGPALGGCRMYPYANDEQALRDVLRLSRGMTYKSAVAELPLGGGKSVIIGDPRQHKTEHLLRAMGRFIDQVGGRYIAAEDSGTSVPDLRTMALETKHVSGIADRQGIDGKPAQGDPSPATAYGVFVGLKAAVKQQLGSDSLSGLKVAIQGLGNVGYRLARHLHEAGAELWVCDLYAEQEQRAAEEFNATIVKGSDIFSLPVDLFAPCAMGAVINADTLPMLKARIIAGAANNQLWDETFDARLQERGILYAPDFVLNAGGIIDIHYERSGYDAAKSRAHVERIADNLSAIFERSSNEQKPPGDVALRIAEERFVLKTP
ncbi:amino acid dehydrogenase [Aestuariirhabdus sp. Z084]|uniref:Glu/Leu/Phe/Val family dehydrogenase n=1 Tax=Aestuariirhabdus haliotis TaxID=2918751 RepID=UPI00201B39F5|nr:Glu/Leu/Phe/Val dehydrogenase [Aestuariirhabdus haliotis]MCL6416858.1 amino acid dehydrogenase [Aestuariirhabdus haliotis]MCL6420866.1 amino acid dehydrogenase [Aestuariirhabdus haliotis]